MVGLLTIVTFFLFHSIYGISRNTFSEDENSPNVAGMRIHNIGENGFQGYTDAWETVVMPNTDVKVIFFGFLLDKINYISMTDQTCATAEYIISATSFLFQSSTRIEFVFRFPLWDKPWRFCIKYGDEDFRLIDDDRTWITTETTHTEEHWIIILIRYVIIVLLLLISGLCSGLNLGLMNLSILELKLIINSATKAEVGYAERILPARKKGNYLLCSILLTNVLVNSGITILSGNLMSGFFALIGSSAFIVIFGEILPQSICYRHGLAVGAKTMFLTKCFMIITCPLAYPIGKILDWIHGETVDQFSRDRLFHILRMEADKGNDVTLAEDLKIAMGAMEYSSKIAKKVMTKIEDVYLLANDEPVDDKLLAEILEKGYTRIPVYYDNDRNKIRSLLHVHDLVLFDKTQELTVGMVAEVSGRELRVVDEDTSLGILLDEFKKGNYHLAMVCSNANGTVSYEEEGSSLLTNSSFSYSFNNLEPIFIGIVTLEDIIEEILQSEIHDEYDTVTDNVSRAKRQSQGQVSEILCREKKAPPLSSNMLKIVISFLERHSPVFTEAFMTVRAREKLIQNNIRKAFVRPRDYSKPASRIVLIQKGILSRRMILFLEGKATVKFENGMKFKVEPWNIFGDQIVKKILTETKKGKSIPSLLSFIPDYDLYTEEPCKYLEITVTSLLYALKISMIIKEGRSNQPKAGNLIFEEDVVSNIRQKKERKSSLISRHSLDIDRLGEEKTARSISSVVPPSLSKINFY